MAKYLCPILIVLALLGLCGAAPTVEQLARQHTEFFTYAIGEFVPVLNYTMSQYLDFGHSFLNDDEFKQMKDQDALKPIVANLSSMIDALDRVNRTTYATPLKFVYNTAKALDSMAEFLESYTFSANDEKYKSDAETKFANLIRAKDRLSHPFSKECEKRIREFGAKFMPRYETLAENLTAADSREYMFEDLFLDLLKTSKDEHETLFHLYKQRFVDYYEKTKDKK